MSQQAEHRIGTVIGGKWRVDDLLGSGSMAAVYAVTHRNGARAALKILHPTLCADPGVCERFLGEGYLTNSVKHPGIVRVLDDGVTDDGCVFLVMDLLEGVTLETLRQERGGRIELPEVVDIADKLMDVLHAVHEAGIIHRDLKPQNVFICDDGSVKLLDFGVARVLESGAQSKLSAFGLVLGTPSFMSPEQALGARDKVDHRSDIWSLGATLFTSLTGQTVHLGPNPQARLLAAAKMNARSIALVKQDMPPQLAAAIDMALRFRKEDRWQSVDAFRRALRDVRVQLGWALPEEPEAAPSWLVSQEAPVLGGAPPADRGERALALMVRANQATQEPDPRRSRPDDDPFDDRRPQAKTVRMGSLKPFAQAQPLGSHAPTPPSGVPPMRRPMPSSAEGSYPAASSTVESAGVGARARRSRAGIWIAALFLVAVAASGLGFFAVKHGGALGRFPDVGPTTPPPPVSAAPLSTQTATSPVPGLTIATPPAASAAPSGDGASGATRELPGTNDPRNAPATAASSVRTARAQTQAPAAPRKAEPPPRAPARPAPVPTSTGRSASELPSPVIPPDPFGTPE